MLFLLSMQSLLNLHVNSHPDYKTIPFSNVESIVEEQMCARDILRIAMFLE